MYLFGSHCSRLKLQNFGHLMRRADSLEKTLMLGKTGSQQPQQPQQPRPARAAVGSAGMRSILGASILTRNLNFTLLPQGQGNYQWNLVSPGPEMPVVEWISIQFWNSISQPFGFSHNYVLQINKRVRDTVLWC